MKEFLKSNKIKNKKFLFLLEVVIYLLVEFELVKVEFTQLGGGRGGRWVWASSRLSPMDNLFYNLRTTWATLMKLCPCEQSLPTIILSCNPSSKVNF